MKNLDKATDYFKKGYSCSQAILSTYSEELGLDKSLALKISTGFGAGMARMAKTCGAITGAYMVLGLKYGRNNEKDIDAKENTYSKIEDLTKKFIKINGSIKCKDLLNCDISSPDGREVAKEKGLYDLMCPKFVRDTVRILDTLL